MSAFASYSDYDALGLADLVRKREVTSLELVDTCIERIEQLNPRINAIVQPMYDVARSRAQTVVRDDPGAPFAGVPFLLKDLLQTVPGVPTHSGSRFWQGYTVDREGTLFRRFQEAGLVTVAKTNTPELGLMPVSEPELFGPTRNPWDLERTAGGSSGGSASAVAAGIVPMASGGDGGGSIRIPSACCGLFGMKPTRGRTPAGPDASEHWNGFAIEHVISRSVRDSAAMLDATHGPEPFAPYHAPHFDGSWLDELGNPPKGGRPLRVAFHVEPAFHAQVHADCDAAVRDVAWAFADGFSHIYERAVLLERIRAHRDSVRELFFGAVGRLDALCESGFSTSLSAEQDRGLPFRADAQGFGDFRVGVGLG